MARLYFDEDAKYRLALELRRLGHDVLTTAEDGRAEMGIGDDHVLRRATELGRVVVTCDRLHYKRLHRKTGGMHAGIITVTQRGEPVLMAQRLHDRIAGLDRLDGQILHIYRGD